MAGKPQPEIVETKNRKRKAVKLGRELRVIWKQRDGRWMGVQVSMKNKTIEVVTFDSRGDAMQSVDASSGRWMLTAADLAGLQ